MEPAIKQLVFKRFRSIPSERITFDNPTIFVGRNGSGKSNLVSVFSFLAEAMASPLQAGGRTNALRALLKAEQERGPDFLRLANAFSALYPKGSEEKRLVDAMLLAVPR